MSHKGQKSFSFFCCFWEKPKRQKRDIHDQKSIRNSTLNSNSIKNKTDTSSNAPIKEIKEKKEMKRYNSYIPKPKTKKEKNDNYFNFKSTISASRIKDNNTYAISNLNKIKNNDMNSNITFLTYIANNKGNKLIDNYGNKSQNKSNSQFKNNINNITNKENSSLNYDNIIKEEKKYDISDRNSTISNNKRNNSIINNINSNKYSISNGEIKIKKKKFKNVIDNKGGITDRSIRKELFELEFEENITKDQFIQQKQNKSNYTRNIFTKKNSQSNIERRFKEFIKNDDCKNNQANTYNYNVFKGNINNKIYSNSYNNKGNNYGNINISSNLRQKNEFCSNSGCDNEINSIFNNNKLNAENQENKNISNNINNLSRNSNKIENKNSNAQIEENSENTNINLLFSDKNKINTIFDENYMNIKKTENTISTKKEGEDNINERENPKLNIYNIISDINSENNQNIYSKTYNKRKEFNYNEFDNNAEAPNLNYLTELYSNIPQEKESILMQENKSSNNKNRKNTEKDNEEESLKDELEDEVGSIDEFHNINDNRSIISSYIFTSVNLTENRSIAQSTYSKSEYQDGISNYNDLTSSRGGLNFMHSLTNNKEFEFRIDKDGKFIPFLRDSKNFHFKHHNSITFNMQINNSIKKLKEKIEDKNKMINDNKKEIIELNEKMKDIEEENKQYEKWIIGEEAEKEKLTYFLNFLMEN